MTAIHIMCYTEEEIYLTRLEQIKASKAGHTFPLRRLKRVYLTIILIIYLVKIEFSLLEQDV